jgi:hypothetical protein
MGEERRDQMKEGARDIARHLGEMPLPEAQRKLEDFLDDYRDLLDEKVTTDTKISDIYDVVEIIDGALEPYREAHPGAVLEAPLRTKNDYQDDEDYEEHYDDPAWDDHGSAEYKKYEKAWEYLFNLNALMLRNFQLPNVGGRRRRRAKTVRRRRSHRRRRLRPTRRRRPF